MNNRQRKNGSVLARIMAALIFAAFCHSAAAADTAPSNVECLLNWAQTFYPKLFAPKLPDVRFSSPYIYRYFANTNSYLSVSLANNHVYFLGPNDSKPRDLGSLSDWLKQTGCDPANPVIFIHGIGSSADTWAPFRDYLINNAGWSFGGVPSYDPASQKVAITCPANTGQPVSCSGGAGSFYTLNFSDNQNLSFDAQGNELAAIIAAVLAANPGKTQVLLVSHSMGALAAREYLQGLARQPNAAAATPYRNDVAKLVTVGAPHQGSFWAEACYSHFDVLNVSGNVGICSLLPLQIDPNSVALHDLQPGSSALSVLNDLATHPLPANVAYVSIVGTGQSTLSSLVAFDQGDGIVTDTSQDLAALPGAMPLQQQSTKVNVVLRNDCGNKITIPGVGDLGETHTCETTDPGVQMELLKDLQ